MQDKKREIDSRLALLFIPVARHIRLPFGSLKAYISPERRSRKNKDPKARDLTLKGLIHCQQSIKAAYVSCALCKLSPLFYCRCLQDGQAEISLAAAQKLGILHVGKAMYTSPQFRGILPLRDEHNNEARTEHSLGFLMLIVFCLSPWSVH